MNKQNVTHLLKRYHEDKKNGVKRGPLHLLKECLEEAGINAGKYSALVRKYGNAPQPVLSTLGKGSTSAHTKHFRKSEVLAYIQQCLKANGEIK